MKIFFTICCLIVAASIIGCAEKDPGLPDGYSILCSPEGKFTLKSKEFGGGMSGNVWDDEIAAKEYAWRWEKIKNEPLVILSRQYQWSDCGK